MAQKLTLRLMDADLLAFDTAAEKIAGPNGAAFVGKTDIIRRALALFNAQASA